MGCSGTKEEDGRVSAKYEAKKGFKEENSGFQQNMSFLQKVNLFKRLPKDQHPLLAANVVPTSFKAGQVVITQGDRGSEFYVIKAGSATVSVSQDDGPAHQVATLAEGDYFGEAALLRDEPRTASITAATNLSTLKLTREKFRELGLHEKLHFANRKAVGVGKIQNLKKPPPEKTEDERELMQKALLSNDKLSSMVDLDDKRVQDIIDCAWKEEVKEGEVVIKEADIEANYFFIVQEGSFDVSIQDEAKGKLSSKVGNISKGGSFGELALLYLTPRAATITAKEDGILWVIDRGSFKEILMKVSDQKIIEYITYLDRVSILEPLLSEEKTAIAKALVEMHFSKGEVILQQGEPGSTFYILYDGEVQVTKDDVQQMTLKASSAAKAAHFFGEKALMSNEPRAATITVVSEDAKALVLDRVSFNLLLGSLEEIIKAQEEGKQRSCAMGKGTVAVEKRRKHDRIQRKDLVRVGLLGCGGFASVELWEHRDSKETYAMKCISKGYIVKMGMQEGIMNEKNIMLMTNSIFIVKLLECFNGSQTLYFLMEAALGGELYATYNRKGLHGSEKHAKFYIAGTVCALEHLHERRIIYRDLKPENLLLDQHGQLKLTDMGLAKFVVGKTYTTCGTPDYFAPELISASGHTVAIDWWTVGVFLFELMAGHPPFESPTPVETYSKVMKGIGKMKMPPKCQGAIGDLIKGLLKKEPSERLPMRPGGLQNVKDHKWYMLFNWEGMESQKLEAPYRPVVKSKRDMSNFTARKDDMPQQLEYVEDDSGWDKDFAT